jgi:hypothetical protein
MERFQFKARTLERKFQRKMNKCSQFRTVTGKINTVIEYSKETFSFKTERNGGVLEISRKNLRKSISYIFFKRSATRKDVEKYSKFSSAIFGVLFEVFHEICRVQRMANGLLRLTLTSTRFYFSGLCRSPKDMELIAKEGGQFVLLSFYNIRHQKNEQWIHYLRKYKLRAIIDSGAFSVFEAMQKEKAEKVPQLELFPSEEIPYISIEAYASFINRYKDFPYIMGFLNLDVIGDPVGTKENYKKLKLLTKTDIIPVWQVSDTYEKLKKLTEESPPLIAIGGCVPLLQSNQKEKVRTILEKVFEICKNVPLHGLGIANDLLNSLPFFSSDSIAWMNARKNGTRKLYLDTGEKIDASPNMDVSEILRQNIGYFTRLEDSYDQPQLSSAEGKMLSGCL